MKKIVIYPFLVGDSSMKQYEAVIEVMKKNGGYSTLGNLYKEVFSIGNVAWGTKTPFASIRRIVQDDRFFFKIRPGLWALKENKNEILKRFDIREKKVSEEGEFTHSYYQGLLLELGNLKKFETFVPSQDKNKCFLEKPLGEMATIDKFYRFTYDNIVNRAKSIDVTWFNERKLPHSFFEVEHSTDFKNSFLKFVELQDFNAEFRVVANKQKEKLFYSVISMTAFKPIVNKVKFLSYDLLSDLHTKTVELNLIESDI